MGILIALLALALQGGGDDRGTPPSSSGSPPVNVAFGEGEYQLGPEDLVSVFIWKQPDLSTTVMIRPDGKISLPLLGEMQASGKTAMQLQTEIAKQLKQYVVDPKVNVMVKEVNSPAISVLGQVRKPDRYHIRQRITALEAIALAGGFTEFAKRDKVTIIRTRGSEKVRIQVDLKKMVQQDRGEAYYLQPLDTVYVQ